MPQKKNPDVAELVRGKTGRMVGNLNALVVLMKSQPLAYNRDNQEDKRPLFDSADTLLDCLRAMVGIVGALRPQPDAMRAAAERGFATATDFADYLVGKGVPFRDAHEIVGRAVARAARRGVGLADLPLRELRALSAGGGDSVSPVGDDVSPVGDDVYGVLTLEGSLAARDHFGGTAPRAAEAAIAAARRRLAEA